MYKLIKKMSNIINDICGNEETVVVKNSGSKDQCPPKPAFVLNMAKEEAEFATAAEARTKVKWDEYKASKAIIPLYKIEEFSASNTEEQKYEGRHEDFVTDQAVKGTIYNHILGDCSYEVVKSLKNAGYTRVFIGLSDGTFTCEAQEDGKIKGQPILSYDVGILNDSEIGGKPQNADITLKFEEHAKSILKPDFDLKKYEGVYDVNLTVTEWSPTSIKFKVTPKCSNRDIVGLQSGNVVVNNASDEAQSVSFVDAVDGVYEVTGTGFTDGFTIDLSGIISLTDMMIESTGVQTLSS